MKREDSSSSCSSETWDYDCNGPFFPGGYIPRHIRGLCLRAISSFDSVIEETDKTKTIQQKYIDGPLLKASYNYSTKDCHLIFTACPWSENQYFLPEVNLIFEAKFEGMSVVVNKLDTNWIMDHYSRKCIFDSDTINPDLETKKHVLKMCDRAIRYYNLTKMMTYAVVAPLKAYYKKSGPFRYFDIRFRATLRVTYDDDDDDVGPYASGAKIFVFEAKIFFEEEYPFGPWIGDGGCLLDVSMGQGSLFDDHI